MSSQALPHKVIVALGEFQNGLNELIDKDWKSVRKLDDWALAITMECAELIDSYAWKWWKNVNAEPDLANVKVEIVDIFHFALSGSIQSKGKTPPKRNFIPLKGIGKESFKGLVYFPLCDTKNAVPSMRNIIQLASIHNFDEVTEGLFVAANDLGMNLVAFYVAKHTLNYIRQLRGYKSGSYVKVQQGVEDNALLHDCIKDVSIEQSTNLSSFQSCWNDIITRVYNAFNVSLEDRKDASFWFDESKYSPAKEVPNKPQKSKNSKSPKKGKTPVVKRSAKHTGKGGKGGKGGKPGKSKRR